MKKCKAVMIIGFLVLGYQAVHAVPIGDAPPISTAPVILRPLSSAPQPVLPQTPTIHEASSLRLSGPGPNNNEPQRTTVPDAGSTALLLGGALSLLGVTRKQR